LLGAPNIRWTRTPGIKHLQIGHFIAKLAAMQALCAGSLD